jgi:ubiquinone biosynthesis protein UbiJ
MTNPVIHAFFLGRAFAEVLGERLEETLTNALSDLGKFDAEQRERLHQFIAEVQARAEKETAQGTYTETSTNSGRSEEPEDIQETIDELRAEIARLRAELKNYRSQDSRRMT